MHEGFDDKIYTEVTTDLVATAGGSLRFGTECPVLSRGLAWFSLHEDPSANSVENEVCVTWNRSGEVSRKQLQTSRTEMVGLKWGWWKKGMRGAILEVDLVTGYYVAVGIDTRHPCDLMS